MAFPPESATAFSWMELCGNMASMSSIVLALSPLPTVRGFQLMQSVGDLPFLPYAAMLMNGFLWATYGFLADESQVYAANAICFVLASYYVSQYVRYNKSGVTSLLHYGGVMFFVFIGVVGAFVFYTVEQTSQIIGILADIASVFMYAGPLASMKHVIQNKSADSIPLPYLAAVSTSTSLWVTYGMFGLHDATLVIPCCLGLLASFLQLGLVVKYGKSKESSSPLEEPATLGELIVDYSVAQVEATLKTFEETVWNVDNPQSPPSIVVSSTYGSTVMIPKETCPQETVKVFVDSEPMEPQPTEIDISYSPPPKKCLHSTEEQIYYRDAEECKEEPPTDIDYSIQYSVVLTERSPLLPNVVGDGLGSAPLILVV